MSDEKPNKDVGSIYTLLAGLPSVQSPILFQPYVIENRVYKNEKVNLDGYTFRNCAFINCLLETAQGNFVLESCHIHLCALGFSGYALRAVRLSSILLGTWDQLNEGLRAQVELDGSFTIR